MIANFNKKNFMQIGVCIFLCATFISKFSLAENIKIASSNLCQRQSKSPAKAVSILVDGFAVGRAAQKWALQSNVSEEKVVKQVLASLYKRAYFISNTILVSLTNYNKEFTNKTISPDNIFFSKEYLSNSLPMVQCSWIKKAVPFDLKSSIPTKEDLQDLALAYLDKKNYVERCEGLLSFDEISRSNIVLKFKINSFKNDEQGFLFWAHFKSLFKVLWSKDIPELKIRYSDLVKSFSVDEIITLIPEGCYSLSHPQCNTDFLNTYQLKDILKKGNFAESYISATEVIKKEANDQSTDEPRNIIADKSNFDSKIDIQNQLFTLMRYRHQASRQYFEAMLRLNTIFNQKTVSDIVSDLSKEIKNPEAEVFCAELSKMSDLGTSIFASEFMNAGSLISGSNKFGYFRFPGKDLTILWNEVGSFIDSAKPFCKLIDNELKKRMIDGKLSDIPFTASRKWFQTLITYNLPINFSSNEVAIIRSASEVNYVSNQGVVCSDVIDCGRNILESAVNLYQVALNKEITNNESMNSLYLSESSAGKVACDIKDPWADSQNRKKKLVADVISSVVSGYTQVPIYLNLDFFTPKVSSFTQLVENGTVKFDPNYDSDGIKKALLIDLGQIAHAPCVIGITNSKMKLNQSVFVFKGITGEVYYNNGKVSQKSNSDLLNEKKQESGFGVGAACTINFEEVALTQLRENYSIFRAGIRLVGSVIQFFKDVENPDTSPMELSINPELVAETFSKYNSIPDECVYELVHGARCMKDLCVSASVAQFEEKTGFKVEAATVWNPQRWYVDLPQKDIWLKVKGCEKEIKLPVNCYKNRDPGDFHVSYFHRNLSCATKEVK